MIVTKPIDLVLLESELAAAGIVVAGLGLDQTADGSDLHTFDAEGEPAEMPPGSQAVVDAHDATKKDRAAAFESAEDAERLRIVNERARTDPAYAALAELALKKG